MVVELFHGARPIRGTIRGRKVVPRGYYARTAWASEIIARAARLRVTSVVKLFWKLYGSCDSVTISAHTVKISFISFPMGIPLILVNSLGKTLSGKIPKNQNCDF